MSAPATVFRLFAGCVPVRGAARSSLCDLQEGRLQLIPNGLHEILTEHRDRTPAQLEEAYGPGSREIIDEYFGFLVDEGYGFWTDEPESFPDLALEWERPEVVTHALVDVGERSRHDFASLFRQLDELGCKALQLRFFRPCTPAEAGAVLGLLARGRLRTVELLVPWSARWTDEAADALCREHPRVAMLAVHSAGEARPACTTTGGAAILFRTERLTSADHCGQVHPAYFVVNIDTFTEARRHNSCLNRKVSIDEHGEIRNCPSFPSSYGNAAEVSLHAAVLRRDFREVWEINKDQVEVCRDCEFRYVCTDCRAFIREPGNRFSKPSKCAYDPYTAQWAEPSPEMP